MYVRTRENGQTVVAVAVAVALIAVVVAVLAFTIAMRSQSAANAGAASASKVDVSELANKPGAAGDGKKFKNHGEAIAHARSTGEVHRSVVPAYNAGGRTDEASTRHSYVGAAPLIAERVLKSPPITFGAGDKLVVRNPSDLNTGGLEPIATEESDLNEYAETEMGFLHLIEQIDVPAGAYHLYAGEERSALHLIRAGIKPADVHYGRQLTSVSIGHVSNNNIMFARSSALHEWDHDVFDARIADARGALGQPQRYGGFSYANMVGKLSARHHVRMLTYRDWAVAAEVSPLVADAPVMSLLDAKNRMVGVAVMPVI